MISINQVAHLKFRTTSVLINFGHQLCCLKKLSPSPGPPNCLPTMKNHLSIHTMRLNPMTNLSPSLDLYWAIFFFLIYFCTCSFLLHFVIFLELFVTWTVPNRHFNQMPMHSSEKNTNNIFLQL